MQRNRRECERTDSRNAQPQKKPNPTHKCVAQALLRLRSEPALERQVSPAEVVTGHAARDGSLLWLVWDHKRNRSLQVEERPFRAALEVPLSFAL